MHYDDKARKAASELIKAGGSQPNFGGVPRRRPPSYKSMYFDPATGDYSIDADTVDPVED